MSTETNEMDSNYVDLPHSDMPPGGMEISLAKDGMESNGGISMENPPVQNNDVVPTSVYVYANSINPVSSMGGDSTIVAFDIVFSVSSTDHVGTVCTHQVVKRIGIDKMKMFNDAKMSTPISVVEAKKPAPKEESRISSDRIKALAGVKK